MLLTDSFSLRSATVDRDDTLLLLAGYDPSDEDDVPHTCVLLVEDGKVRDSVLLDWRSSAACSPKPGAFLIFGEFGNYMLYENGSTKLGRVFDDAKSKREGVMRAGCTLKDGAAVWLGMSGLAFERSINGDWSVRDKGLPEDVDLEGGVALQDGGALAFGWKGAAFRLENGGWSLENLPTNVALTSGAQTSDGVIYLAGQNGTILKDSGGGWEIVAADSTGEEIWGLSSFGGKLFVSTMSFVYVLRDQELSLVEYQNQIPETCYHLTSSERSLWSIGAKDLFRFSENVWEKIDLPNPL